MLTHRIRELESKLYSGTNSSNYFPQGKCLRNNTNADMNVSEQYGIISSKGNQILWVD